MHHTVTCYASAEDHHTAGIYFYAPFARPATVLSKMKSHTQNFYVQLAVDLSQVSVGMQDPAATRGLMTLS